MSDKHPPERGASVFLRALLIGMSAPAFVFETPRITRLVAPPPTASSARTSLDALRGDWARVGQDFSTVIARETKPT
ncbi:MAG: hypothetical protein LBD68_09870 [Zoogloeaceae bacterium]|jgi:hypothetical protein|nr:hypothetical protein [Zoogloeaceae bacterium]